MNLDKVQLVIVWLVAQGFVGTVVSWIAELPGLNLIKMGWKKLIMVLLCLIASFLELVGTNQIILNQFKWIDLLDLGGVAGLIFIGSQIWWKKYWRA
jgi:hypothetical protein